jgi:hypothetical protein
MIHEMSDRQFRGTLASMIANSEREELSNLGFNGITDFEINDSDFQTIKIQLRRSWVDRSKRKDKKSQRQRDLLDSHALWRSSDDSVARR